MEQAEYPHAILNRSPKDGGSFINAPYRGVLHTTESDTFTPRASSYFGHSSFPHFTIVQRGTEVVVYQHISIGRAARALRNAKGGVQTNRARAIQIEIVGRAAHSAAFSEPLLAALSRWMRWVESKVGVKPIAPFAFKGSEAYGVNGAARMTPGQWMQLDGWCGHQHVPENDHWDPGLIPIDRLLAMGNDAITVPSITLEAGAKSAITGKRFMVNNVAPDDVLNCRERPGARNALVSTFVAAQKDIEATDSKPKRVGSSWWRELKVEGGVGWANDRYLAEHWTENSGMSTVVVRGGDRLNVRAGPGVENVVVTRLSNATAVEVSGIVSTVGGSRWREIRVEAATGWVNAHYLGAVTESSPQVTPVAATEPDKSTSVADPADWSTVPYPERRRFAMHLLTTKYGYSTEAAAGIVGNLMKESDVIPNRVQQSTMEDPMTAPGFDGIRRSWTPAEIRDRDPSTEKGPRTGGIGLAQWTAEARRNGLFDHTFEGKRLGTDILFSMQAQMDYLVHELRSEPYKSAVNSVLTKPGVTVVEASDIFVYKFEKPATVLTVDKKKLAPLDDPRLVAEFEDRRARARIAFDEFVAVGSKSPHVETGGGAAAVATPAGPKITATVVLDPGHGGSKEVGGSSPNNAKSPTGALEKTMTLEMATLVRDEIKRIAAKSDNLDITVVLTRDGDVNLGLRDRARVARDRGAEVLLSIHFNAFDGKARGVETLVRPRDKGNVNIGADREFAARIQSRVFDTIRRHDPGTKDRGVKAQILGVLNDNALGNVGGESDCRSALLEVEFLDVPAVDDLLVSGPRAGEVKKDVAVAIAEGIIDDLLAHHL